MANSMSQGDPKISVVVPLYNHEKYIGEALHSVLSQSFADFELIVMNDGSSDNSENIVKGMSDDRIRYFYQDNQGAHAAINRGVQLARGEYVSILNSDDVYESGRLEECVQALEADASLSAAFSHIAFIDEKGEFIKYVRGPEDIWTDHDPETWPKEERNIVLDLLAGNFLVSTSNLFCRKKVFDTRGGFVNLRYAHDYEFFLRLCYHEKTCIIEKPLLKYRIHPSNTIRKDEAEVSFEVGLILANFFLRYDIGKYFSGDSHEDTILAKLFDSLNTYKSEKMIMILLLRQMRSGDRGSSLLNMFADNPDNPFRKKYLDWFNADLEDTRRAQEGWEQAHEAWQKWKEKDKEAQEGWKEAHEAWQKWKETDDLLTERDQQLAATSQQLVTASQQLVRAEERIQEKIEEITSLLNSTAFRLGKALTWPLRRVRDMVKDARK